MTGASGGCRPGRCEAFHTLTTFFGSMGSPRVAPGVTERLVDRPRRACHKGHASGASEPEEVAMSSLVRKLAATGIAAAAALAANPAAAQCPSRPEFPAFGSARLRRRRARRLHALRRRERRRLLRRHRRRQRQRPLRRGLCCSAVVAWDAARGVHPNAVYPDCTQVLYTGRHRARASSSCSAGTATGSTRTCRPTRAAAPEEKDYLTVSQAMRRDLVNGDTSGTATLASLDADAAISWPGSPRASSASC